MHTQLAILLMGGWMDQLGIMQTQTLLEFQQSFTINNLTPQVYIIHDVSGFFHSLPLNLAPESHKIWPDPPNNYFLFHFRAIIF